jgi:lipopolysaccharide export system permease protein
MSRLFPSATLTRYMAWLFISRVGAFLFGLVAILQTLDLMSQADDILAAPGATNAALLQYISLRLPQLIGQFAPFAVLLGTLVTLATLAQASEVVIMKATGISAHRILMPLFAVALLFAGLHFAFNESVVVRANDRLDAWRTGDFGATPPPAANTPTQVWVRDGATIIHARNVMMQGTNLRLEGVTIYTRDTNGNLTERVDAARALNEGGQWRLEDAKRTDLGQTRVETLGNVAWATQVPAARFLAVSVEPEKVSFLQLHQAIGELKAGGQPTGTLEAALMHKLSAPLSALLMPLLGAVAAFGLARSGRMFLRVVIGLALGFAYFVADNFMMAMGQFGAAPPLLAAWAPFLLFFLIGEAVLFRTEE